LTKRWYRVDRKKLICVLSILGVAVFFGYFFVLSWLLGFVVCRWGGGKRIGERGRIKSIIIPIGRHKVHLHHWVIALLLIGLSFVQSVPFLSPAIVYGFLGGVAFHGIYSYADWHRILIPRHRKGEEGNASASAIAEAHPG